MDAPFDASIFSVGWLHAVTLDIDDTCDPVHGRQQLSLFHAHYDTRCFLPVHVYHVESGKPVAVLLRPGKTPSGVEVRTLLKHLVRRIRRHWPRTRSPSGERQPLGEHTAGRSRADNDIVEAVAAFGHPLPAVPLSQNPARFE